MAGSDQAPAPANPDMEAFYADVAQVWATNDGLKDLITHHEFGGTGAEYTRDSQLMQERCDRLHALQAPAEIAAAFEAYVDACNWLADAVGIYAEAVRRDDPKAVFAAQDVMDAAVLAYVETSKVWMPPEHADRAVDTE